MVPPLSFLFSVFSSFFFADGDDVSEQARSPNLPFFFFFFPPSCKRLLSDGSAIPSPGEDFIGAFPPLSVCYFYPKDLPFPSSPPNRCPVHRGFTPSSSLADEIRLPGALPIAFCPLKSSPPSSSPVLSGIVGSRLRPPLSEGLFKTRLF